MTNEPIEPLFVRKAELARLLGVSLRTVDDWLARRLIPYVAVSSRLHLFNVQEVEEALRKQFGVEAAGR
jgi:excisionase family DNA binding protein